MHGDLNLKLIGEYLVLWCFSRKMWRKRTPRRESPLHGPVTMEDTELCTPNTVPPPQGTGHRIFAGKPTPPLFPGGWRKDEGLGYSWIRRLSITKILILSNRINN